MERSSSQSQPPDPAASDDEDVAAGAPRVDRRAALAGLATWSAALASLALAPAARAAPAAAPADRPLRFGQSAPITGPSQAWGIEYMRGIKLAFEDANGRGGINGRPLELVTYDDGYEAVTARENTTGLLNDEHVFGLVGYMGADSVARSLPLAVQAGVPFVAPLTGDEALRRDPPRQLFLLRPGDEAETRQIASALATIAFTRTAVLQQDDADGAAAVTALLRSLAASGMPPPAVVVKVPRNAVSKVEFAQRDVEAAAEKIAAAKPHAVICLTAFATTAAVVKRLHDTYAYAGGYYATSLSGAAAIGPLLGTQAAGLTITQVVPSPFDSSRPLVAAYQKRLAANGTPPEYVSLEGWIAGRLVVEALGRATAAGAPATRERFMAALESLSRLDLGGFTLHWDAARRQFSSQVSLTVLDARGRPRT
jgi:ABC-type branched-subunit amino acid transport system substrate-binding protein